MPVTSDDLSALAEEAARELHIPGAQISVLDRGQLLEGVTGLASVETGVPITTDTLFSIGSTTKVFTAALVMQCIEEGFITLDTPVVDQLPGFALSDPDALRTLTPRHLMSMSSGIDNGPYTSYGRSDDAVAQYVHALAQQPHNFAPGSGFGYSNASTVVSGRLIQHVTGKTWEQALETRLLEPAKLHDSAAFAEDIIHRRFALGHERSESGAVTVRHQWTLPRSIGPAGGTLCSTATDLVRFAGVFLREGHTLEGVNVLSPRSIEAMQAHEVRVPSTLLAEWWGLGPYGKSLDGIEVLGHGGTTGVGSSYLVWSAELDLAVATTVNAPEFGYPFAARVQETIFKELANINVPPRPTPPAGVEVDPHRLVGTYAMSGITVKIRWQQNELTWSSESSGTFKSVADSPLVPLTPTTFLPTHPAIDGRRGWGIAFIGPEDLPATHLINGVFALRRIKS